MVYDIAGSVIQGIPRRRSCLPTPGWDGAMSMLTPSGRNETAVEIHVQHCRIIQTKSTHVFENPLEKMTQPISANTARPVQATGHHGPI